mmetsp:Transcript_21730/g.37058  ORF Transcript_21730/g.37058 Transcript_21730/m.37058 type:complete len:330 (-) Transcript_21730:28-1017(-)
MSKTWQYEEYGDESKLQEGKREKPKAGETHVVIKIIAAGVNPVDWKLREGYIKAWPQSFPIVPGWDAAGIVEEAPAGSAFKKGDKVYSYTRPAFDMKDEHPEAESEAIGLEDGTAQEYIAVTEWKVAAAPKSTTLEEAAGVPLAGLTAYQGLFEHGKLEKGQTVLLIGASGGVGSYAVGLAKEAGATVIGVCSTSNVDYVKKLGADEVIDYKKGDVLEQLKGKTIDVAYDMVGGDSGQDAIKAVKDKGIVVSICNWSVKDEAEKEGKTGISFLVKPSGDQLRKLADLIDSKKIQLPKIETLPLADIAKAHKKSQEGRTTGKLVLTVAKE